MKFTEHLTASLITQFTRPVFFALHDHLIVPHRYGPDECKRRDRILLERNFVASVYARSFTPDGIPRYGSGD